MSFLLTSNVGTKNVSLSKADGAPKRYLQSYVFFQQV